MHLTVDEAAALTGIDASEVRNDMELGVVAANRPVERLDDSEILYFEARRDLGFALRPADRRVLLSLVREALGSGVDVVRFSRSWVLDLGVLERQLRERVDRFEAWKRDRVVEEPSILAGEPVFRGTRLAVRHVGGLQIKFGGPATRELREDYSYLTEEDLELAQVFTLAYPKADPPRARPSP